MKIFRKNINLSAYLSGKVISLEDVNDGIFSEKLLGDGLAIEPASNILLAPEDGNVILLSEDTGHACGLRLNNGLEVLLHIGIDTANMKHKGFDVHVKVGDKVKKGTPLITFDRELIAKNGYRDVTIMLIANQDKVESVKLFINQTVNAGDIIMEAKMK